MRERKAISICILLIAVSYLVGSYVYKATTTVETVTLAECVAQDDCDRAQASQIAYHEAGHAIAILLLPDEMRLDGIDAGVDVKKNIFGVISLQMHGRARYYATNRLTVWHELLTLVAGGIGCHLAWPKADCSPGDIDVDGHISDGTKIKRATAILAKLTPGHAPEDFAKLARQETEAILTAHRDALDRLAAVIYAHQWLDAMTAHCLTGL